MNSTQHLMEVSVRGKHRPRNERYQCLPQELAGKPARRAGIPASIYIYHRHLKERTFRLW